MNIGRRIVQRISTHFNRLILVTALRLPDLIKMLRMVKVRERLYFLKLVVQGPHCPFGDTVQALVKRIIMSVISGELQASLH